MNHKKLVDMHQKFMSEKDSNLLTLESILSEIQKVSLDCETWQELYTRLEQLNYLTIDALDVMETSSEDKTGA